MIRARNLTLDIGSRRLLEDVSFQIERASFTAVLGPNGVGKTTLLRTIAGLRVADHGTLLVDEAPLRELDARLRARRIAFVAADEEPSDGLSVREVVATARYAFHRWWEWYETQEDCTAIDDALAIVAMNGYADRRFATLSSGERQRVWLALALAQEAPILLLDEPTSHLDVRVAHQILDLLRSLARAGKTIVCALHDLNDAAAYADRLLLLGCGRLLADDTPEHVLAGSWLEAAYGIGMETVRTPSGQTFVFPRLRAPR